MIYFTKYAEQKFDILNKHKVYFTKEQIEDVVNLPDKVSKKGKYLAARKDDIKAVYQKENGVMRIITFYPVKA
ncbi:hypothetical protein KKC83_04935 [Patescibacteria group bacterium]|nr:hypothetical protein [Candidatus Falkowbacteria bacterium]MBU3906233.1 hypothetical protein [Patescibacteria group bacterium]MBU4014575.1 hypothetical protein [Patescibacteria group bacterium]MBU4026862.1 hypothetical protein [Patescibacteria group bacterium]MBU4073426.1 hypothetical protein [Patescibacteria group bacterium]